MEVRRGGQTLVGFPALIDKGTHVEIEVFDEPDVAAAKHRAGLRRLVALQIARAAEVPREEHPRPAAAWRRPTCRWAPPTSCASRSSSVALDRAFLADPLPHDAAQLQARASTKGARA